MKSRSQQFMYLGNSHDAKWREYILFPEVFHSYLKQTGGTMAMTHHITHGDVAAIAAFREWDLTECFLKHVPRHPRVIDMQMREEILRDVVLHKAFCSAASRC